MKIIKQSLGHAYPLGATYDGQGTNFSLFSANAEKVELCLFDSSGKKEISRVEITQNDFISGMFIWRALNRDNYTDTVFTANTIRLKARGLIPTNY